jgi:uncharacterized integral membrane protein
MIEKEDEEVESIIRQASRGADESVTLREGNISLILNNYDDIFSDFDPRAYSERSLSDDFLYECEKAVRDKDEEFELRFLVPKAKRNLYHEVKIKKRLKDYFQKHATEKNEEVKKVIRNGLILTIIGFILMVGSATMIFANFLEGTFTFAILLVILEPAGWFFFWEGLAKILLLHEEESKKKVEAKFYKRMMNAKIEFFDY